MENIQNSAKEASLREIFCENIHIRYWDGESYGEKLRRAISNSFYSFQRRFPFFILSPDALNLYFESDKILSDERKIKINKFYQDDYICITFDSIRNYISTGEENCKEAYFFRKEKDGDYSLRGFLTNIETSISFLPTCLFKFDANIYSSIGYTPKNVVREVDVFFTLPTYVK